MNKMSMAMLMGMTPSNEKRKVRPATVKKLKEMRQGQRLSLTENVACNVLWARQNSDHLENGQGIKKESKTQDFSNGGIGLLTKEALEPFEIVQLNISFSRFGVTIPTIAEVVWVGRRPGNGLYRIGLRYLL